MNSQKKPLAAIAFLITAFLTTSIASAGHYYESVTLDQTEGKRGDIETKVKAWVEGDNSRVEFQSGENRGWFSAGNYLVTTDGGENVYLVNPKEETYGRFNMKEMFAALGQGMEMMEQMGGMMKMEFTDVSSEKLLEEPGGKILGHATTHYRYRSHYTMNLMVMGLKQRSTVDTVQDIWATDDFDARGFGMWLSSDSRIQTGNDELDELLSLEMAKIKGFPLKMTNDMTTTNKKGKQQKNTSTTEVLVLREESVSGDKFTWPSQYVEIEIIPNLDNIQTDDGEKKEKKKGRFGGLLKRKKGDG